MSGVGIIQFDRDLKAFAASIPMELVIFLKKLTVKTFDGIVELTPVDTGRARASWALALGQPSEYTPREITDAEWETIKAAKKGKGVAPILFDKPEVPLAVLEQISGNEPIYITSNLVYIEALEEGHSKKAPAGMVRITVAALELELDTLLS